MKKRSGLLLMLVVPLLMLFAGCGGGGDGSVASTVSGVAATGAPMVGTVYLKDSSTPAKELSGTIKADGTFSFNIDGLTSPFILKAQGTAGGSNYTLYSFSSGPGIANINPFANLAVACAAGSADLAALYAAPTAATMQSIAANLGKAAADIQSKLQPMLTLYNATANPVSDSYTTNHLGLDGVLDMVKVEISATGAVTLTNKLNNAVIYTGSISNFTGGTLTAANIPQPPVVVTVTPGTATVKTNGTASFAASVFNSTNTQVTWSVVEAGGGTITSSGVYSAPSSEGTYHVKAASVADPTKSAIATVAVTTGLVDITINPSSATVTANGMKTFIATVTGTSHTQVTWSVVEPNGGNISVSGVYTAPPTAGTYHVKAVSLTDPTKSATSTISVTPAPQPFPIGTWVGPKGVSFTVSSLVTSGLVNQYAGSVTYSGGTITVSGTDPMNQIMGGSGNITVAVSQINGASGTVISFASINLGSSNPTQLTGVLSIQTMPPSAGDYMNVNAVFTKK